MLLFVNDDAQDQCEKNTRGAVETRADSLVSLLLQFLSRQEPAHMPDINSLAASLNMSGSRLRHVIKQKTGVSYGRYIKALRLRRARQLLQETLCSVKQAMLEVGLSDHSHFARDYKKEFGESPTQTQRNAIAAAKRIPPSKPQNSHSGHKPALAMAAASGSLGTAVNYPAKKL